MTRRGEHRAVFLDRDGVLTQLVLNPDTGEMESPHTTDDLRFCNGILEPLWKLQAAGFQLFVVSNQPSWAKGKTALGALHAIAREVEEYLEHNGVQIREFYYCYHHPQGIEPAVSGPCECRKPSPFFLLQAAEHHGIDLRSSWMIGDRASDMECGRRASCATILLAAETASPGMQADFMSRDLRSAAHIVCGSSHGKKGRSLSVEMTSEQSPQAGIELQDSLAERLSSLRVRIFADGADLEGMIDMARRPWVAGFTTNPTLMRKAGVADYRAFAREVLSAITDRPISFEVFADDLDGMRCQALDIASWGSNVYVKIPVTNTVGVSTAQLVRELSTRGVKVNITALMTLDQVRLVAASIEGGSPCCVSLFAGRIADTGRDPVPLVRAAVEILSATPNAELIWASPREILNVFQADQARCHIITVTNDMLAKLALVGKDLEEFSLETVRMFHEDARGAEYQL